MNDSQPFPWFTVFGVEIEYAIVDDDTLDVRPLAGALLQDAAGEPTEDHDDGEIGWSNELAAHQIELKNTQPVPTLDGVAASFQQSLDRLNALLAERSARLLPTGMHPWMVPRREARLWHGPSSPVYHTYDHLFDCRRHGWTNLQATHLNLPFASEAEFATLLAAVRVALPLIPALAASSPFVEGAATGLLDNRLDVYRTNSRAVPALAGEVIPEPVFEPAAYRDEILGRIDAELAAVAGAQALIGHEWANARGAIARFDRDALEVRLIDVQECPRADIAICALLVDLVRALCDGAPAALEALRAYPSAPLVDLLQRTTRAGPRAALTDPAYARLFAAPSAVKDAGELWAWAYEQLFRGGDEHREALEAILQAPLAARILEATGPKPAREDLEPVYRELSNCLAHDLVFRP